MTNYSVTMKNCEEFYKNSHHNYVSKTLDERGFTARIDTSNRSYSVVTLVEEESEFVVMEIYPGIHCAKETQTQTAEYISKINDKYKIANIRISFNGNIYIHTEQRINNSPITIEMFKEMEGSCIIILNTFESVIEKLAHARLIGPEEADVDNVIAEHKKTVERSLMSAVHDKLIEKFSKQ